MREGLRSGKLREGLRSGKLRERPRKDEILSGEYRSLPKLIIFPKDDESCMESTKLDSFSEVQTEKIDGSGVGCQSGEGMDECQTNGILQYRRKRLWDDNGEGCVRLSEEKMKKKVKKEISACEIQNVDRVLRSRTRSGSDFKKETEIAESGCTDIDTSGGQNDNLLVKIEDDGANQPIEGLVEQKVKKKRGRPPKIRSEIMVVKNKLDRIKKVGGPRKGKRMLRSKGGLNKGVTISSPERSRGKGTASSLKFLSSATRDKVENLETCGNLASSQESSEMGNNKHNMVEPVIVAEGLTRASEKKLVRDRIIELLLSAGWTIDYRPRNGKDYDDAVYVSVDGKTHWSVTKAYRLLKQRYEDGDREAYKDGFVFSPIPAEELGILNKVFTKKREAKKANGSQESKIRADRAARKKKGKHSSVLTSSGKSIKRKKKGKFVPREECESTIEAFYHTPSSFGKRKRRDTKCSKRCTFLVRSSGGQDSESNGYVLYKGKRTTLAWMIDLDIVLEKANVSYMNQGNTEVMLEGKITTDGIDCNCCGKVITISEFESHAGSKLYQALQNTYLHNGISIVQCLSEAWKKQEKIVRQKWFYYIDISGDDTNDDTCGLCGDGGNLVCCDGCPSTFHQSCLDIQKFPPGDWHCLFCSCKFCGIIFENANGREDNDKAAPLLLNCGFCNERYHRSCSDAIDGTGDIEVFPSFCGKKCQEIYSKVEILLGVKHEIEEGFSWTLLNRSDADVDVDLSSKETSRKVECNCKIAVALSVMDECFLPMPDHRSGINLIHNIMYNCGSNFNRLDFSRFYTVTLEKGEEIIAAATIRIHGNILAEMPFIGTRYMYRRQGMCRRLLNAIESFLCSLDVEKLVIPAVSDLEETWTSAFGFEPLDMETQRTVKRLSLLVFPGVAMLQKLVMSSDGGFSREKQNHAAEGLVCSSGEDVQTTGDAIDVFGGNCSSLVKLDLNVAAPPEEGEPGTSSDITTENISFPNCATKDCREVAVIPSAAGPSFCCAALESESCARKDDVHGEVMKDIDASAAVDQTDGCVATSQEEGTPSITVLGAAERREEDGVLGMSSSSGGCRDVKTVTMAPAETCLGHAKESAAALKDLSSTECGEFPATLEGLPLAGRMNNDRDEMKKEYDDALNMEREGLSEVLPTPQEAPTLEGVEVDDDNAGGIILINDDEKRISDAFHGIVLDRRASGKEDEEHARPELEEVAASIKAPSPREEATDMRCEGVGSEHGEVPPTPPFPNNQVLTNFCDI